MPTIERRITTTDTIPASDALSGLASSNVDSTCLTYIGTVDLLTVYKAPLFAKSLWVYMAAGTPNLARVTGMTQVDYSAPNYTFLIQLDRSMTGASSSVIRTVTADLLGYSYKNDGGTVISANGITMPNGTTISEPQLAPAGSRVKFQEPVLIDPNGGSVLVIEDN